MKAGGGIKPELTPGKYHEGEIHTDELGGSRLNKLSQENISFCQDACPSTKKMPLRIDETPEVYRIYVFPVLFYCIYPCFLSNIEA